MTTQTQSDRLQQWIEEVDSVLEQHNINLLTRGMKLSLKDDRRETEGYLVVITEQPPVSVMLGIRNRENGGSREAFFCVVNGTWQEPGEELVTITNDGNNFYTKVDRRGKCSSRVDMANRKDESFSWVSGVLGSYGY